MANKNSKNSSHVIQQSVLPPLSVLLRESWELFKKTWTAYIKLVGLAVGVIFLTIIIGIVISLPVSIEAMNSHAQLFSHLTSLQIADLILIAVWIIFFFLLLVVINVILPIVSIFIVNGKDAEPLFTLIKQSKKYFWIYFLTMLLADFLIIGGLGLFIIPGVIIGIFFAFAGYEVVLEQQAVRNALQRSYLMVKNNFWSVFGRLLLVEVCYQVVSNAFSRSRAGDFLFILVSILFSLFAGWYIKVYIFLLYKQLHKTVTLSQPVSFRWIWIVSIIGWIVAILIGVSLYTVFGYMHNGSPMPSLNPHPHHTPLPGAV